MKRVFIVSLLGGKEEIHYEVLEYNPRTHLMKVRVKCGIEYERYFDPNSKYNRTDFKIVSTGEDDAH